jgi:hypothetical protein
MGAYLSGQQGARLRWRFSFGAAFLRLRCTARAQRDLFIPQRATLGALYEARLFGFGPYWWGAA